MRRLSEKKKRVINSPKVQSIVNAMVNRDSFRTDPFGMYTGKPVIANEVPTQDQDDL